MKKITLTKGYKALVDDADYKILHRQKWHVCVLPYTCYAYAGTGKVAMHRIIMGMKKGDGLEIDHLDNNGLNNQRANLEIVTRSENRQRGWDRKRKIKS